MSYLDDTKHTPGPWQFWKGVVHPDQHETMGVMRPGRHAQVQTDHEPDLRLIAAAPELLEACSIAAVMLAPRFGRDVPPSCQCCTGTGGREINGVTHHRDCNYVSILDAIAKAEGGTP